MPSERIIDAEFTVPYRHRLRILRGVFDPPEGTLASLLEPTARGAARVLPCVDAGFFESRPTLPDELGGWLRANSDTVDLAAEPMLVPAGEDAKNEPAVIDDLLAGMDRARLCRRSFVLAIGGGAVLDAVGYAAALLHRGIRIVRVPTTTLSQADSGVGVKNGVNALGKKNLAGVFAVPWAVINDADLLSTLPAEHWRAGFAEAIKVALLKDAGLFTRIESNAEQINARDLDTSEPIISRSAELHLRHITEQGDPFELGSSRPLDFGHWSAHRIEQMTHYETTHGDAVAIGLAIDCAYAAATGIIGPSDANRVVNLLESLGFELDHESLDDTDEILGGIEAFREHIGGELVLTMASGIGCAAEIREIDDAAIRDAIAAVRSRAWA